MTELPEFTEKNLENFREGIRAAGLSIEEAAKNFEQALTGRDGTVDECPKDHRGRNGETADP